MIELQDISVAFKADNRLGTNILAVRDATLTVDRGEVFGIVGGGGVGDLAIRFGYYRYQTGVMVVTVITLVILVQAIQMLGDYLARRADIQSLSR